jgi:aminoglycoside phosphotransferase (APT) family kinase protein
VTRPWQGEIDVTSEIARQLVRSQFPALDASDVRPLGSGWDNTAFLVDRSIVFRFPRKVRAVSLLETEARVLPVLSRALPVRVPVPEWFGTPSEDYPWPFLGYRVIPGKLACAVRLGRAARIEMAPALASFLTVLHAVPAEHLALPPDLLDRHNFAARLPLMVERLDAIRARGLVASSDPWLRLFHELEHTARTTVDFVVHGDLYARHLLVDEAARLSGVIDWGDVHAGDGAMDLMLLYGFLPPAARPSFEAEYGEIADDVLRTARLRAAFHAISVTWYGVETEDDDLLHEGRLALDFVLED